MLKYINRVCLDTHQSCMSQHTITLLAVQQKSITLTPAAGASLLIEGMIWVTMHGALSATDLMCKLFHLADVSHHKVFLCMTHNITQCNRPKRSSLIGSMTKLWILWLSDKNKSDGIWITSVPSTQTCDAPFLNETIDLLCLQLSQ